MAPCKAAAAMASTVARPQFHQDYRISSLVTEVFKAALILHTVAMLSLLIRNGSNKITRGTQASRTTTHIHMIKHLYLHHLCLSGSSTTVGSTVLLLANCGETYRLYSYRDEYTDPSTSLYSSSYYDGNEHVSSTKYCSCIDGYKGNPYVAEGGCVDIDECAPINAT